MRVAIYKRISDDREGRELGVGRQHEDCSKLAERRGDRVVAVYCDNDRGASTRSKKPRPDYKKMLAAARAGEFDKIIAYTTGRLTRRPREHEDLIDLAVDCDIKYEFVASPSFDLNTSAGRRIARILAANDAGEAEDIAERVQREVRQRAEHGEYHGGPKLYGVSADGKTLIPEEAEQIRKWYQRILGGGSLHGLSVEDPLGRSAFTIKRIVLNPRCAGIRILNGVRYPAPNPPIVPLEQWRATKAMLEDPGRRVHNNGPARKHLGTGLFVCRRCDRTVQSAYDNRGNRLYKCLKCYRTWLADRIDKFIVEFIEGILGSDSFRDLLADPGDGVDVEALRAERIVLTKKKQTMAEEWGRGDMDDLEYRAARNSANARLEEIAEVLEDVSRTGPLAYLAAAEDPVAAFRGVKDLALRQAVINALIRIEFGEPIRGRAKWVPEKFIFIDPK